jgi:multicomponent K+:H+ antiporter subunit A
VVGATVLILVALAHQSRRGHRRPGAVPVEGKEAIGHTAPAVATSPVAAPASASVSASAPALEHIPPAGPGAAIPVGVAPNKDL